MVLSVQTNMKLLTIKEAAQVLHVHENTLRRWCDHGVIPAIRICSRGDRRIYESSVDKLLSQMQSNDGNSVL
jgi:excisionase family DNA binding protein